MYVNVLKTRYICRKFTIDNTDLKTWMLCKPPGVNPGDIVQVHKCMFSNPVDFCLKYKNNLKQ